MLEVEAQAGGEPPASDDEGRFVVEGGAERRIAEVGGQQQLLGVAFVAQGRADVGVFEDELLDAGAFEADGRLHRRVAVETESPDEPAVAPLLVRPDDHFLREGVFGAGLAQREVGEGRKSWSRVMASSE